MVVIADKLRALWTEGPDKVSTSRLTNMEKCYVDCHAYLAEFLSCTSDDNKHCNLHTCSSIFEKCLTQFPDSNSDKISFLKERFQGENYVVFFLLLI